MATVCGTQARPGLVELDHSPERRSLPASCSEETLTDDDGHYEFLLSCRQARTRSRKSLRYGYEPPSPPADSIGPWRFTPVRSYRAPSSPI